MFLALIICMCWLQIEELVQGLALEPFKGQLVENLGRNEVQRLKLAGAMLRDTDVLVAENVLKDMDLYDLAFLVDFIRDWAQRLRKICIIALSPPTPEILTMFGKAALLTCGRLVFAGDSADMCAYFQSIGYDSPPFKNPCDYYGGLSLHCKNYFKKSFLLLNYFYLLLFFY